MIKTEPRILLVDDEEFNLEILAERLQDAGYATVSAKNGTQALKLLSLENERFDAVLLDRMMPEINGLEVLRKIKADAALQQIPVILQTAMASKRDIEEGLEAGAYYYLTKPYSKSQLLAIVKAATEDHRGYVSLQSEVQQTTRALALMSTGSFSFRTLQEGRELVMLLAGTVPEASNVALGLSELVINAVEHGSLGITYEEKGKLRESNTWEAEIERRQALPQYRDKLVRLGFEGNAHQAQFLIHDQGAGFDWRKYMQFSPDRVFDSNGRGIAMANSLSFDKLEYLGNGNQVLATIILDRQRTERAEPEDLTAQSKSVATG